MDFRLTSDQKDLQKAAYEAFSRWPAQEYSAKSESGLRALAEEGWVGLALPESAGGSDLGLLEQVLTWEASGYYANPDYWPFLALGAVPLTRQGLWPDKHEQLASGECLAVLAVYEQDREFSPYDPAATAVAENGGYRLSGDKTLVPALASANYLLYPAQLEGTLAVFAVPVNAIEVKAASGPDLARPFYHATVRDVTVPAEALLAQGDAAEQFMQDAVHIATVGMCAELVGAMEAVLDRTVTYVKEREQFGGPIGRFQAVKHRCADMKVMLEGARSAVYYAAWAIEANADARAQAVSVAKAFCSREAPGVIAHGLHLHGGMGFTWEVDVHLYYRRSLMAAAYLGDAHWHGQRLAASLLQTDKEGVVSDATVLTFR